MNPRAVDIDRRPFAPDPFSEYVPEGYDGPRPEQSLAARDASSVD